jgi:hypothetical protein
MSIVAKLKAKLAMDQAKIEGLPEVGQPMLERIENSLAGGKPVVVWCQASWGQGCDKVNVD